MEGVVHKHEVKAVAADETVTPPRKEGQSRRRIAALAIYLAVVVAAVFGPLMRMVDYVSQSEVHSYILLVPLVTAYLIYIRRDQLPSEVGTNWVWGGVFLALGLIAVVGTWRDPSTDSFTFLGAALFLFVNAGVFLFLGKAWARAIAFPLFFLIFIIPLPVAAVDFLEEASKNASAEVANALFLLTGTPTYRDGTRFLLPGMAIEVAKECSGIRSSLVLIITSALAANLFLRSWSGRALLVASVIPLGLLRNGFRILVVALLCVHIGPHMINSPIHRRGGPIFFALSLIPLFGLMLLLRRIEQRRRVVSAQPGLSE